MKRRFLLKASKAHTAADFDLRQIASTSGRLDILCRCILAAFTGPKGLRADVDFTAILEGPPHPPLALTIHERALENLARDEETVASWIFRSLEAESSSGGELAAMRRMSFEKAVREVHASTASLFYLHENGEDLEETVIGSTGDVGFILGDQVGLDAGAEKFLDSLDIPRVSLGPRSYLSSSCIVFVNSYLDLMED